MNDTNGRQPAHDMKREILEKIRAHEVRMRPKAYFTLQMAALALLSLAILAVTILIVNFVAFSIRINSRAVLLSFGPRGVLAFLRFFPWKFLAIDIVLTIGLGWLLRQFRFGYRNPAIYLFSGIFALSLAAGIGIDRGTPVNDVLSRMQPPRMLDIYGVMRRMPPPGSGLCRCMIMAVQGNTLIVKDPRGTSTLTVILPLDDPRATTSAVRAGDTALIVGDPEPDGTIRAFGVRDLTASLPSRAFPE